MALHLTEHRGGFGPGFTAVTRFDEEADNTGIGFGVLRLTAGETLDTAQGRETAWLLMHGRATVTVGGAGHEIERQSLFDESPSCIHVAAGEQVRIECADDCEFSVFTTPNGKPFPPRVYTPADVPNEHRGKGQVDNACYRFVRTIFDGSSAHANTELVLGEVVTMPGRWSSYPPHHHPQPEIYHYRFTKPQGYGHAELGDDVYKVRQFDTVKIFDGYDHAQAAAPGYGMYYSWVIRHLEGKRYTVPDFTEEHTWVMEEGAKVWRPADLGGDG